MKQISVDDPRISWLSFEKFDQYLKKNNWQYASHPNALTSLYAKKYEDFPEPITILLPKDFELQDAPLRLAEAINQLSTLEQLSPYAVIREIEFPVGSLEIAEVLKINDDLRGIDPIAKLQPLAYFLAILLAIIGELYFSLNAVSIFILIPLLVLISFALRNSLSYWNRSPKKYFSYLTHEMRDLNSHKPSH
jgi:hypothetical protein